MLAARLCALARPAIRASEGVAPALATAAIALKSPEHPALKVTPLWQIPIREIHTETKTQKTGITDTAIALYKMSMQERLDALDVTADTTPLKTLGQLAPNVIGVWNLPLGVATKFPVFLAMALEEPSVIAGASGRAGIIDFSQYKTNNKITTIGSIPIEKLAKHGKDGMWYANRVVRGYEFAKAIPKRAGTGNKGIDNGVAPVEMSHGLMSHKTASLLHFLAKDKGINPETGEKQYGPLIDIWISEDKQHLMSSITLPIIQVPAADHLHNHEGVKIAHKLSKISDTDHEQYTAYIAEVAIAQHLAAMISLASKGGITANHMPHHHASESVHLEKPLTLGNLFRLEDRDIYRNLESVATQLGLEPEALIDGTPQSTLTSLIEQGITSLRLPLAALPIRINHQNQFIPWAGQHSSSTILETLAQLSKADSITAKAPKPIITGQVQLRIPEESLLSVSDIRHFVIDNWENLQQRIIQLDKETDTSDRPGKLERMQERGGFSMDISVDGFSPRDAVIHFSLNPDRAMGANLIDRAAECFGEILEQELGIESIFRILTNDHSNCLTETSASLLVESFKTESDRTGEKASLAIIKKLDEAEQVEKTALEINTVLTEAVIAQGIATGQDTRALTASLHLLACKTGTYKPLVKARLAEDKTELIFELNLPTRVTNIGRMKSKHMGVKASLLMVGNGEEASIDNLCEQLGAGALAHVIDYLKKT